MSDQITVMFTCHGCGLQAAHVQVTKRAKNEKITDWMPKVQQAVANRHSFLSPNCTKRECDLAIPLPDDETSGIGMAAQKVVDGVVPNFMKSRAAN